MRRIYSLALALALLAASPSLAARGYVEHYLRIATGGLPGVSPSTIPGCLPSFPYWVIDGDSADDCSTGGGSFIVNCVCNSAGTGYIANPTGSTTGCSSSLDNEVPSMDGTGGQVLQCQGAVFVDSTASEKLLVKGTGITGAKIEDTGGDIAFLGLASGAESWNVELGRVAADAFGIFQGGGGGTRLAIDTNGNVGIGAAPSEDLHVYRSTGSADLELESGDTSASFIKWTNTTAETCISNDAAADRLFGDKNCDKTKGAGEEYLDENPPGGAPTSVNYLIGTASGSLPSAIVVGTSPGGQLGGTWASPTVDTAHAADGSNCSTAQAAQGVDNSHAAQSCIDVALRAGEAIADNQLVRGNSTTGVQGSGITVDDSENMTNVGSITQVASGDITVGDDILGVDNITATTFTFGTTPDSTGSVDLCRDGLVIMDCASSLASKTGVRRWSGGLSEVLALRPVSFRWRSGGPLRVGLAAEDVAAVIPEAAVIESAEPTVVRNYEKAAVIAALVGAIQDQQKQISVLRGALLELDRRTRCSP